MRRWMCVPMIALCVLLTGCGSAEEPMTAAQLRRPYQEMSGCVMEAQVTCDQSGAEWTAELRCEYIPDGDCTVEVLSPESIAGVKAVFRGTEQSLEYEGAILNAGTLGGEEISPAVCLIRLMEALRGGWLLEENAENWQDVPCLRLTVDQSGSRGGKILSTLWLRAEDGTPLRGEIAVEDEIILTAEFTSFEFYDKMIQ
ncbi:MAG: hypothetical protein E7443_05750 [Ruminococcaceae bacterium]|nr:hypothetical protein [Oscillospiraceae bacterium]